MAVTTQIRIHACSDSILAEQQSDKQETERKPNPVKWIDDI